MSSYKTWPFFSEESPLFFVCVTKSVTVSLNILSFLCLEEGTRNLAGCVENVPGAAPPNSSSCPRFELLEDGDLNMPSNWIFMSNLLYKLAVIKFSWACPWCWAARPAKQGQHGTLQGGRGFVMLCQWGRRLCSKSAPKLVSLIGELHCTSVPKQYQSQLPQASLHYKYSLHPCFPWKKY